MDLIIITAIAFGSVSAVLFYRRPLPTIGQRLARAAVSFLCAAVTAFLLFVPIYQFVTIALTLAFRMVREKAPSEDGAV